MNLRLRKKTKLIGFIFLLNLLTLVLGWVARSVYYDITWEDVFGDKAQILSAIEESQEDQFHIYEKKVKFQEASPDGKNIVTLYKLPYNPTIHTDYYKDYFQNQKIIAVKNLGNQEENYIFIGEERTGNPQWLGNDHIFFTTYCGTACKGIYLVDVKDKETRLGVLSYVFSEQDGWQTHFKDWFGKEFVFAGMTEKISSKILANKTYLVFELENGQKNYLLFTDNNLREESSQFSDLSLAHHLRTLTPVQL